MTYEIGRLTGYGNYDVGGYMPQRKNDISKEAQTQEQNITTNNHEETQVDPSKVMDFLASNNFFVEALKTANVGEVDAATKDRFAGYMEQFEMIYGIVKEEFGEELAPAVMDIVMDKLMGME